MSASKVGPRYPKWKNGFSKRRWGSVQHHSVHHRKVLRELGTFPDSRGSFWCGINANEAAGGPEIEHHEVEHEGVSRGVETLPDSRAFF